ncbi:THAP-type domain-containing protein [Aphis craccivora]|uniref:THAP-type domain-containing protein n=1 Tax=Aphis craccivora TaxID=307492 RepID=A0A6G0YPN5_APHCR|nr:THAP-type domain-containing protein [Aphis craccivora]
MIAIKLLLEFEFISCKIQWHLMRFQIEKFYSYVSELDTIFVANFPTLAVENDVGKKLKNLVDNVPFNHPCPKYDVGYLKLATI